MVSRKMNNSIKNREDLTHLRGTALGEAAWNTKDQKRGEQKLARRHFVGNGGCVSGIKSFKDLK